jgi:hypothetical protein
MKLRSNASAIFPITTRSRKQINISFLYLSSSLVFHQMIIRSA